MASFRNNRDSSWQLKAPSILEYDGRLFRAKGAKKPPLVWVGLSADGSLSARILCILVFLFFPARFSFRGLAWLGHALLPRFEFILLFEMRFGAHGE